MLPKDPAMLLSVVNTRLRDMYSSLSELAAAEDIDEEELKASLAELGYAYDEENNCFK